MTDDLLARAEALDAADPLAHLRDHFITPDGFDVVSYLDGNSLGRPLRETARLLDDFVREQWAGRLIRGWTEGWMQWPLELGDRLGTVALGAAPGQVVVADSTTVLLYKMSRAAVDARPGRRKIVLDTDNFPTDRYVLEGIAAERGLSLVWIETDPAGGASPPSRSPTWWTRTPRWCCSATSRTGRAGSRPRRRSTGSRTRPAR
nr:hypothetical protein GCM10020092_024700 [Actinoplanes digitatis]